MTNTYTSFSGKFKDKYGTRVENTLPDGTPLCDDVAFVGSSQKVGAKLIQPVLLSFEHGITYSAADNGAFALNDAVAAIHKPAEVVGAQIAIQSAVAIEVLARGLADDRVVGDDPMADILRNMKNSIAKHVEMTHLWGGTSRLTSGWGVVSAISGTSTTRALTIKLSSWAPAIWSGAKSMPIALYDNDGSGGIPSSGLAGHSSNALTISSVDLPNRKLNVTGDATELSAVDTAVAAGDVYVFPKGAKGAQWVGLNEISTNTGTLFAVDGATYEQFQGNTHSLLSAPLSLHEIVKGLDKAVGRGLEEDVVIYINHNSWTAVAMDQAALRKYDGSYSPSEFKNGAKSLKFYHQSGEVMVKTHKYMKEGYAMAFPKKALKRVGAQDITFKVPDMEGEEFLYHLPSNMGMGLRAYTFQGLFSSTPSRLVMYDGIVNA